MKISDYIIDYIEKNGVSHIFELIGGSIVHLLDSTYDRDSISCVSVRHEQTAAFAAEGYARINGKLGVAMATSGPGALNLLTGIGSCYFDSVPTLFITGQVNTYEYKFDKEIRQIGFQETDIVNIVKPITKYAVTIVKKEDVRFHLEKAIFLARHGRPGPVVLDIPMDIQRAETDVEASFSYFDSEEYLSLVQADQSVEGVDFKEIRRLLLQAKRPMILIGGGVRLSNATEELLSFADATHIPFVTSLMGLDAIHHDHDGFFGLIGSYGNRYSNMALANCDLLFILGSRLDTRQTGTRPDTFARAAVKIHVDIDPLELNEKLKADIAIRADLNSFLAQLNAEIKHEKYEMWDEWYATLNQYRNAYPTIAGNHTDSGINPNLFMDRLSSYCQEGDIICLDVGQHQMWASQSFRLKRSQRLLNSGGMGAMGYALPAAIGTAKASPSKNIIVIAGDGGFQVNIQDLDTVVREKLPIRIFIMNNQHLGMVRQFQDKYFDGRKQSTVIETPDFCKIAQAYGLAVFRINPLDDMDSVIQQVLAQPGPVLVEVMLNRDTDVRPKLVVNRPIEDMWPHLDEKELRQMMVIEPLNEKNDEQ